MSLEEIGGKGWQMSLEMRVQEREVSCRARRGCSVEFMEGTTQLVGRLKGRGLDIWWS